MDYFRLFGTKSCVFDDLILFLDVFNRINREAVLIFIHQVQELVDSEPIDFDCPSSVIKENVINLITGDRFHDRLIFCNSSTVWVTGWDSYRGVGS